MTVHHIHPHVINNTQNSNNNDPLSNLNQLFNNNNNYNNSNKDQTKGILRSSIKLIIHILTAFLHSSELQDPSTTKPKHQGIFKRIAKHFK